MLDSTKRDSLNCTCSASGSVDAHRAWDHCDRLHCSDESSFAGVDGAAAVAAALTYDVADDLVAI